MAGYVCVKRFNVVVRGSGEFSHIPPFYFEITDGLSVTEGWDGDGKTVVGVYRPKARAFCLRTGGDIWAV